MHIHMDTLIRSLREYLQRKKHTIIGFRLLVIMHTLFLLSFSIPILWRESFFFYIFFSPFVSISLISLCVYFLYTMHVDLMHVLSTSDFFVHCERATHWLSFFLKLLLLSSFQHTALYKYFSAQTMPMHKWN